MAEAYSRGYVWDGKRRGGACDKTQIPKTYPGGILLLSRHHLKFPTGAIKKERYMGGFGGRKGNGKIM